MVTPNIISIFKYFIRNTEINDNSKSVVLPYAVPACIGYTQTHASIMSHSYSRHFITPLFEYYTLLYLACSDFGGILHPSGDTCCASACGNYCGASNCHEGPGGWSACCGGSIAASHYVCGVSEQMAPCKLPGNT